MKKKRVLITGASRGIGRAISEKFADANYELLLPSHSELDLSSDSSVDNFLSKIKKPVEILINNAGINPIGDIKDAKDENIEEIFRVNLISPLRLIRRIIPIMIKEEYGRIVNVSSVWSVVAKPGRGVYAATKSGLNALTRSLAVELAPHNILVNSVSPGFVETELTRKNNSLQQIENILTQIPLGRLAKTDEIAELILFLASNKNTYITGQNIIIDGGFTCL